MPHSDQLNKLAERFGLPADPKKLMEEVEAGRQMEEVMRMPGWKNWKRRLEVRIEIVDRKKDLLGDEDHHKYRALNIEMRILKSALREAALIVKRGENASTILDATGGKQ